MTKEDAENAEGLWHTLTPLSSVVDSFVACKGPL
jgi:hypothetical protein